MSLFVSPTEPELLKGIGIVSSLPEKYGADVIVATRHMVIGVQRKVFPGDFLSSMSDGRLSDVALKLAGSVQMAVLVLEGKPRWTHEGVLLGVPSRVSRSQVRRLLLTLFAQYQVLPTWTDTLPDTIELVNDLYAWAEKDKHTSLLHRPSPSRDLRGRTRDRDRAAWIMQGLADGMGPEIAGRVYDHFGRVPLRWDVTEQQMREVKGMGPKRIESLRKAVPFDER